MIELPGALRWQIDLLEDRLLQGLAVTDDPALDALVQHLELHCLDDLPQALAHGFVAASPQALAPLFQDQMLRPLQGASGHDPGARPPDSDSVPGSCVVIDDAQRLQWMSACVFEVFAAGTAQPLVAGHLRCGLIALRIATSDAVLAMVADGTELIWPGIYPAPESFEAELRDRGYLLELDDWEALDASQQLAWWGQ
jgi:hypothetical protein